MCPQSSQCQAHIEITLLWWCDVCYSELLIRFKFLQVTTHDFPSRCSSRDFVSRCKTVATQTWSTCGKSTNWLSNIGSSFYDLSNVSILLHHCGVCVNVKSMLSNSSHLSGSSRCSKNVKCPDWHSYTERGRCWDQNYKYYSYSLCRNSLP